MTDDRLTAYPAGMPPPRPPTDEQCLAAYRAGVAARAAWKPGTPRPHPDLDPHRDRVLLGCWARGFTAEPEPAR